MSGSRALSIALVLGAAVLAVVLLGATGRSARATADGTPTEVGAFNCIATNGGQVTRPAGSTIVIRQVIAENARGALTNFLGAQTTIVSANDAQMVDASDDWGEPAQQADGSWQSKFVYPTGVTLGAGESMRFTFALVLSTPVPEAGVQPGQPARNGPGLNFGGTCTVTAS